MHLEIIDPPFGPQEWQEIAEPSQGCKKRRERLRVSLFLGVVAGALIPHLGRGQRRWQPSLRERKQIIDERAHVTREMRVNFLENRKPRLSLSTPLCRHETRQFIVAGYAGSPGNAG